MQKWKPKRRKSIEGNEGLAEILGNGKDGSPRIGEGPQILVLFIKVGEDTIPRKF